MRLAALLVVACVLGGCASAVQDPSDPGSIQDRLERPLSPSCDHATDQPADGSACAQWLGAEDERNLEASLAVHPRDPDQVLVAWTVREQGEVFSNARVLAAMTTDAGKTWRTTDLKDENVQDVPGAERYAFDQRAAFGPDGTAYVMYGGEGQRLASLADGVSRITLAVSKDDGTSWTYRRVAEMPGVIWDFFGFAVAPDTGHLFVATGEIVSGGVWFWRSVDGGATWSVPTLAYASAAAPHGLHRVPELAAGPGGYLVLVTQAALDPELGSTAAGVAALASRDGGISFEPQQKVADSKYFALLTSPVAASTIDNATITHVLVADEGGIYHVRSEDLGRTWEEPVRVAPVRGGTPRWGVLATSSDGAVNALVRTDDAIAPAWTMSFDRLSIDGFMATIPLGKGGRLPNEGGAGDDYGGLAVGPDGTVWAAFSDPRGQSERIAVVRLGAT